MSLAKRRLIAISSLVFGIILSLLEINLIKKRFLDYDEVIIQTVDRLK